MAGNNSQEYHTSSLEVLAAASTGDNIQSVGYSAPESPKGKLQIKFCSYVFCFFFILRLKSLNLHIVNQYVSILFTLYMKITGTRKGNGKKEQRKTKLGKRKGSDGKENTGTSEKKRKHWSPEFITSCKAQGICTLISELSEAQRNDVISIGFHGLIEMNFGDQCCAMFKWLVEKFDGGSRIFHIDKYNKFAVTAEDVCDIFLLPINDRDDVVEYKNKGDISDDLRKEWEVRYKIDVNRTVAVGIIRDKLLQLREGGDDFKRMFVLYTLSTFLAPVGNRNVDFRPLKSLLNVSNISRLNWCQFVLNKLCNATERYKNPKKSKGEILPEKKRWFNGCIMVLQITYLHRFKWQGRDAPRSLPLIKHWNTNSLRDRVLEEKHKSKSGFGSGVWDTETYPISGKSKELIPPILIDHEEIPQQTESASRYIKLQLNKDELDDDQIKDKQKDVRWQSLFLYILYAIISDTISKCIFLFP